MKLSEAPRMQSSFGFTFAFDLARGANVLEVLNHDVQPG